MKEVISIGFDILEILDKVMDAVNEYERKTGKKACLHMSRYTSQSFPCPTIDIADIKKGEEIDKTTDVVCEWEGTKFFIDDALAFGIIEISEDIKG